MTDIPNDERPVTPSDDPLANGTAMGIHVLADGDLHYKLRGGGEIGPYAATAGSVIPGSVTHVMADTTATVSVFY